MIIKGQIKKDKKTKQLINRLNPGDIALISHKDLDELAGQALAKCKVRCVINTEEYISGKYPNGGPSILINAGIPIFECFDKNLFNTLNENQNINIIDNKIIVDDNIFNCNLINKEYIKEQLNKSYLNIENELDNFIENTLEYAKKEKGIVTGDLDVPKIKTKISKKHVLIVVRGKDYKRDLEAIRVYIKEKKPILIGVDGGGDALLEFGYIPDIIIGDMDSVSDTCLKLAKEVIVHGYIDGNIPGLARIKELNVPASNFLAPGTSEDIALLLAYHYGADLIVALGTHSNMIDFLEKGRPGMASTFLVRLKVGSKLVDAKGVNKLYRNSLELKYILSLCLAALLPIIILSVMFPPIKEILQLIHMRFRLYWGF